ncbi:hypothetical protein PQX77_013739 [Marasmius sp. AFHP31]|nr:hypothetical protein PQX77_013739 [Marasmius sp. AFHP31]
MSTFFPHAQNITVTGGVISHVEGDQHNYYRQKISRVFEASSSPSASGLRPITHATTSSTTTTVNINGNQINQIIQREEKERSEFDDFRNVKRGDICKLRNICQAPGRLARTFCTAKLIGVEGEFTTVSYSGRDAQKVFKEEFFKLSRKQFSEASQVFAIANGTIPSMVLWHNLIPLAQFKESVGPLGLSYLECLRIQLGCQDEELWIDSSRGVICHGPKGPYSEIPGRELDLRDLPPTAELLQDEVLVRFLGCQKSREADDAFMYVMSDIWMGIMIDEPERVHRPTIFSALTKTPIAIANNVWKSNKDNLVEQTCLENGWTRFRLDGDGWLCFWLNQDIKEAWLSQAGSVFHVRGVSLDDDVEDFHFVYPEARLDGNLDNSPSKCQLRRQQHIFLFIYPPPPNLADGKTSSLHHWSFQEDGHSQISPESCRNLGLPVELDYKNYGCSSYFWPTTTYKSLHQYQIARGFDPTTADFARHLGYPIFEPLDDSDRFEDVQKDQTSPRLDTPTNHGGSLNIVDSEYPSNTSYPIRVEDVVSVGNPQDRGDECYESLYHDIPNKRRKTHLERGGIEARNHPHQVLRHKDDPTEDGQCTMDAGLRPIQPLPARNSSSPRVNPPHYVQQSTSAAQLHPMHHNHPDNRVSYCYPPLLTGHPSPGVLSRSGSKMSTASIRNSSSLPTHTVEEPLNLPHIAEPNSFDTESPFTPCSMSESSYPINKPNTSTTDSPYADPSTYSVGNPGYAANDGHSSGWSGDWQPETPNHRSGPPFVAANTNSHFVYHPSFANTPIIPHPSHSTIRTQVPYLSHGEVLPPLRYPSGPFDDGRSLNPQHGRSESVMHPQPQLVFSRSWAGSDRTPSYGQRKSSSFEYGESEQWGRNNGGERWY